MAAMASSSRSTFLTAAQPLFPLNKKRASRAIATPPLLCCRSSLHKQEEDEEGSESTRSNKNGKESQLAKLALVAVAAGMLALGSPQDAVAAKSGGRVGGQAFRSSAPRSSGPRINNSRTNIYINPPVAPPLVGGYGYGVYGGWGWSPFTFFAPGPSIAVGIGGGFDLFLAILAFGAIAAVIRRFRGSRDDYDEDKY